MNCSLFMMQVIAVEVWNYGASTDGYWGIKKKDAKRWWTTDFLHPGLSLEIAHQKPASMGRN